MREELKKLQSEVMVLRKGNKETKEEAKQLNKAVKELEELRVSLVAENQRLTGKNEELVNSIDRRTCFIKRIE